VEARALFDSHFLEQSYAPVRHHWALHPEATASLRFSAVTTLQTKHHFAIFVIVHKVIPTSVVTVSHLATSVDFGSVLVKKPRFRYGSVFILLCSNSLWLRRWPRP